MAALSWTAANVRSYGVIEPLTAGGTVARGNVVRKNTSNQIIVAINDSAANAAAYGIALNDAGANQPVSVHVLASGGLLEGSTFAVGKVYALGTAGATIPVDDIAGGEFIFVVGVGYSATQLRTGSITSGVAAAGAVS